jgi:hypothetical protein
LAQCWQCWPTGGPVTRLYLMFFPFSWGRTWPSRWKASDSQPVHYISQHSTHAQRENHCCQMTEFLAK